MTSPSRTGTRAAVLFDLDGTLLRTPDLIVDELVDEAEVVTGSRPSREQARALVGLPLDRIAHVLGGGDEEASTRIVAGYRRRYVRRIVPLGRELLFPGVGSVLCDLRADGFHVGVVTNKGRPGALEILRSAGIDTLLDVIVTADDCPRPKPSPDPVLIALERLGSSPRRAVMVGDTEHDVAAASAAGCVAVGVAHGVDDPTTLSRAGAAHVVDRLMQVPPIVHQLVGGPTAPEPDGAWAPPRPEPAASEARGTEGLRN